MKDKQPRFVILKALYAYLNQLEQDICHNELYTYEERVKGLRRNNDIIADTIDYILDGDEDDTTISR